MVMRREAKRVSTQAEKAPPGDSIEERRLALVRKVEGFAADWRRCPRRVCRRMRGCEPPESGCCSPSRPARQKSPEREAADRAWLARFVARRVAELRGGGSQ
jgi:hypothetical protein